MQSTDSEDTAPRSASTDRPSQIALKFGFDPLLIETDSTRWNKEWEKALRSLAAGPPKEIFDLFGDVLGRLFAQHTNPDVEPVHWLQTQKDDVRKFQKITTDMYNMLDEKGHFRTAWILLDEKERQRHIQNGLREACDLDKGRAFFAFIDDYRKNITNAAPEIYIVQSAWWETVANSCGPLTESAETIVSSITLSRNEFIAAFAAHVGLSILKDFALGSPGMNPVVEMIDTEPIFARGIGKALANVRSKPLIRCENCTKSPDMIEGSPKFMMCSVCKSKLDFVVHYCSLTCQKDDWRNHKKHCGRQKVSKKLRGTVNDPYWMHPDVPEYVRDSIPSPAENVAITDLGFPPPNHSRSYSPALQRQIMLCLGDKNVDYFLFDASDHPIRVYLPPTTTRWLFREMRTAALSSEPEHGVLTMGEYLIKRMSDQPGLSRERILDQLGREYGEDMKAKITQFETFSVVGGVLPGSTFLEKMGENVTTMMPRLSNP
ncbi:hypothetical protein Hypma_012229 [Hypsizygus marmoreus]|uniref:MYND-type domain-containing protein n=1 Tax=Hypsizygus marmoreus TaxID=39966 RepID=A0A369JFH0_HYPMA|nr:hypothetical protein Hypma_012229 [Hypsizygus marmoreus]